jgi:thiamine-phosphate pyrophosphorylase
MIRRMDRNVAALIRLMLVTDDHLLAGCDPLEVCRSAVRGGVTSVQLRLKEASPRELLGAARALIGALSVPVLVNDRLDVAIAAGAAGVHLGPDDLPVRLARAAAPPGFLLGVSVGSVGEASNGAGADYWGVGPWRVTATKADAGEALGAAGFERVAARSGGIPCVGIGNVRPDDVSEVIRAGGVGVAVASGILRHDDVTSAARAYADRLAASLRKQEEGA